MQKLQEMQEVQDVQEIAVLDGRVTARSNIVCQLCHAVHDSVYPVKSSANCLSGDGKTSTLQAQVNDNTM